MTELQRELLKFYHEHGAKRTLYQIILSICTAVPFEELEDLLILFIEELQKNGDDINTVYSERNLLSVTPQSPRVLKAFVEAGGDINHKDDHKRTALWTVVENAFLQRGFDYCASVDFRTPEGREGFYNLLKLYLELGANPNDFPIAGRLAVYLYKFDREFHDEDPTYAKRILDLTCGHGMNLSAAPGIGGVTPLGYLIDYGANTELIREFLEHGADPNVTYIPMKYLEEDMTFPFLYEDDDDEYMYDDHEDIYSSPLLEIIKGKKGEFKFELAELLLEYGADPNLRIEDGNTVIFDLYGDEETGDEETERMISLLSKYGADFNIKNLNEENVLTHFGPPYYDIEFSPSSRYFKDAIDHSRRRIPVKTFLELGTEPIPSNRGDTPLHILSLRIPEENGSAERDMEALIKAGNDVNAKNKVDMTPFAFACLFYGYWDWNKKDGRVSERDLELYESTLFAFVNAGADINALTDYGVPAIESLPEKLRERLKKAVEYRNALDGIQELEEELYER